MELSRARLAGAATAVHDDTAATLAGGCGADACTKLCGRFNARVEREIETARETGLPVACAPGCSYCCHQRVRVFRHEAVALFAHVTTRLAFAEAAAVEQRIRANAATIDSLSAAEHRAANLPCAFLRDDRCLAYEARPSICASFHSLSRERCRHSFEHPEGAGTASNARPVALELQAFADALIAATHTGLDGAGLSNERLELHQAVRALLDERDTP